MARKTVSLRIEHPISIGNKDVTIAVYDGSAHFGDVTISQGGIDWRPSYAHQSLKKSWADFAKLMRA